MTINTFLFSVWPGTAVACFLVGTIVRYGFLRQRIAAVREEMSGCWKVLNGGWLWQLSLGLLVAGHVAAWLLPGVLIQWNANPARLYLFEGCALAIGLTATCSTAVLIWRHLNTTVGSAPLELFDTVFIALIFAGLVTGIGLAVIYRWGSSWAAITLSPYLSSVFRGKPVVEYALEMPALIRLHVFCAFSALAMIPLTRLSLICVWSIDAGLGFVRQASLRPRVALGAYADMFMRNLGSRLWPEED